MIVLVTGGRDYKDAKRVSDTLDVIHQAHHIEMLVHGCATGADTLAAIWAMKRGVHPAGVPALWDFYGKIAGRVRNSAMLVFKPDLVVAFPGGSGTANMVGQARQLRIPVTEVNDLDLVS